MVAVALSVAHSNTTLSPSGTVTGVSGRAMRRGGGEEREAGEGRRDERKREENNIDEMWSYIICTFCASSASRASFHYSEHQYSNLLIA